MMYESTLPGKIPLLCLLKYHSSQVQHQPWNAKGSKACVLFLKYLHRVELTLYVQYIHFQFIGTLLMSDMTVDSLLCIMPLTVFRESKRLINRPCYCAFLCIHIIKDRL